MQWHIREIQSKDNQAVESIIRTCLIEYGANHEGTAWCDPNLSHFYELYQKEGTRYWVAEDENGKVVGGVGIGKLDNNLMICELQKMYCLQEARGTGIAKDLLLVALDFARLHYQSCYLETLDNMVEAQKFYEKNGFIRTYEPIAETQHFACDIHYLKKL